MIAGHCQVTMIEQHPLTLEERDDGAAPPAGTLSGRRRTLPERKGWSPRLRRLWDRRQAVVRCMIGRVPLVHRHRIFDPQAN